METLVVSKIMETMENSVTLNQKWESALNYYFECYDWDKVAQYMNVKKATIREWWRNKDFQVKLQEFRDELAQIRNDYLLSLEVLVDKTLLQLIEQNDNIQVKLEAIKEFFRKLEKMEEIVEVQQANTTLLEIKEAVRQAENN